MWVIPTYEEFVCHFVYLWDTKLCIIDKLLGHLKDKKRLQKPSGKFSFRYIVVKVESKKECYLVFKLNK